MNPNAPPFRPMSNYAPPIVQETPLDMYQQSYHQPASNHNMFTNHHGYQPQQPPQFAMGPSSIDIMPQQMMQHYLPQQHFQQHQQMPLPSSSGATTQHPTMGIMMVPPQTSTAMTPMAGEAGDGGVESAAALNANNMLSADLLQRMYSHANCAALFEVQIGLEQLIYESHEFDTWSNAIRDRLTAPDVNDGVLAFVSDIIIEMAVHVNDCQYNFSRLCQFLDNNIRSFVMGCFVPQLNDFAFNRRDYEYFTPTHRQNFIRFLAELYDKIELNGIRFSQISSLLFEQIDELLKNDPHDGSVKTVIQAMKLIGRHLESDQGAAPIDQIMSLLGDVCNNSPDLSENVKGQVLALHQLRANNWGILNNVDSSATGTMSNGVAAAASASSSSSVFIYGPDGKQLSEEEYAFLEESCAPFNGSGSNWPSDSNTLTMDDEEVMEDFEKFLHDTAVRAAEKALERSSLDDDNFQKCFQN